ncbi:hypothetical protein [Streptomyces sp. NPDC097610]|uniref:hypothetical protein n=1 Tax=Streptomyces sp. NPDC097610 TaxID=3157227 RepID=UPI00332518B9
MSPRRAGPTVRWPSSAGGQAGLSVGYRLHERGIEHVVVEAHRVGHAWRERRWDSLCLLTPNWQCKLPGHPCAPRVPMCGW